MSGPSARPERRSARAGLILAALAGLALAVIGVRFLISPDAAARFFGVGSRPPGIELHSVVGIRDLWLGMLAVGFAALRDYRALALWLALGAIVCVADALVVMSATGKASAIAFHLASGVFCIVGGGLCWRSYRRTTPK